MDQTKTIWITIIAYIGIIVVIGIISGKKTKGISDLTVGGRSAGAWLSALSYGTAYFSAVMFVGYAGGTGKQFGLWAITAGLGNAIFGSWLAWKVLARKTRDISSRLKIATMPQFFEARYQSKAIKTFSAIVIFIFLVPYSASVYKGLASIADVMLGIDGTAFMVIIALMASVLLVLGGYRAQARADFFQGIVMIVGVSFLLYYVIKSGNVNGFDGIREYAKTDFGLPNLSKSSWVTLLATVLMTSFGTWGLPQMIQKFFGIKDDKQAKRGVIISTLFCVLIAGGGYFIGSLTYMFFTPETLPAQDYIIPEILSRVGLSSVLMGIVIVLLISASVSTLCSITLTASSTFSIDLIKSKLKPDMGEKKLLTFTRLFCILFIVLSYAVANTNTPILDMMSYSWGIISGSFLAPYVLALYWKKLNYISAWSGMLTGFLIALIPAVSKILNLLGVNQETIVMLSKNGPLFAVVAMISSILVIVLVTLLMQKIDLNAETENFYKVLEEKVEI